jgi:hypothetical protein
MRELKAYRELPEVAEAFESSRTKKKFLDVPKRPLSGYTTYIQVPPSPLPLSLEIHTTSNFPNHCSSTFTPHNPAEAELSPHRTDSDVRLHGFMAVQEEHARLKKKRGDHEMPAPNLTAEIAKKWATLHGDVKVRAMFGQRCQG